LEGHVAERVQVGGGRGVRVGHPEVGDLQLPAAPAHQQAGRREVTVH
jgi:hypothetical protein